MKHYFLIAKDVGDLTRIVCAALEERQIKHAPVLSRVLGTFGIGAAKTLEHGFMVERGRLNVESPSTFRDDPVNLIRLFHIADREGVLLHPDLVQRTNRSLGLINEELRNNAEANRHLS